MKNIFFNTGIFYKLSLLLIVGAVCNSTASHAQSTTFGAPYGTVQSYTVPAGCTKLGITLTGGCGGAGTVAGGNGGLVTCTYSVTPGLALNVYVGAQGSAGGAGACNGGAGGPGGAGGVGALSTGAAGAAGGKGGGSSAIRIGGTTAASTVLVAGGGGGGGGAAGGAGNTPAGGNGTASSGTGGAGGNQTGTTGSLSQTTGSVGGAGGTGGVTFFLFGNAGGNGAGGGGGGWWGGAGGGAGAAGSGGNGGGGGGGSNYIGGAGLIAFTADGINSSCGNGTVVICAYPFAGAITGTGSVCVGSTITLSNTTATGTTYTWTSGNPAIGTVDATTGIVGGVGGGTVAITYAATNTCGSMTTTTIVTVNAQPAVITGPLSVCAGSDVILSDVTTPGTWSATGTATVSVTGDVTGVSPGTATITYTNSLGCTRTAIVTVNAVPGPINGNAPICQGSTITLTDATGGGVWSSVSGGVAAISTAGVVTGSTVGTSLVSYTIGSCASTVVVTVNTQPAAITGTFALCQGATTLLTDVTPGGGWSSVTTTVANIGTDGTVTASSINTGTSTISYLIGSCVSTKVVTVNTQPAAILGNTPICQTFSITLSDATAGGIWSSVSSGVAGISTAGVVTGSTVGTSLISYTIGSCAATVVATVNTQPAAITGSTSICQGFTSLLSDVTAGGVWSSVTTTVASIGTDGTVTASSINTGTSTISYLIGNCVSTTTVTVNTQPVAITGNTPVCAGLSLNLSDGTAGGGWNSGNTSIATVTPSAGAGLGGIITGVAPGTVVISYTIGSCFVTTVVTINVQPGIITGPTAVCKGFTINLTDATGGGAWSSIPVTTASVTATGVVTGVSVGTAIVTYAIGTCSVTQTVTVNTQPTPITGNTPVCQTFSITLSDATSGGVWSSVSGGVAAISTAGVVTGGTVGTSVISYAIGLCAATTIVTVDLQPAIITGTLAVCKGLTTALTDASTGGTWSSVSGAVGTISTTGVLTGINSGTTTISYTIGICAAEAVATVNPLPLLITGTKSVCSGFTTTLSDATPGGTWSSSNTAVATVGASTGVVTGSVVLVTSTATITYTLGTGCIMTTTVTVNPLPTAILGANAVCHGSTTTLSDAGGGTWSSNNTTIASISSTGVVTGNNVGVTTITYTLPTGCYITAPMTVNPLPGAINGATFVCVGSVITLTDGTGGGTWSSSNTGVGSIATSAVGNVTGVSAGTTTISYILTATGCYVTQQVTVNLPTAIITPLSDTTFCPGGFVALTANTGAGYTYQWYAGGAAIAGAVSSSYIATAAGSYQVGVTNTAGCYTLSIPMQVTIDTPAATLTTTDGTTVCDGTLVTLNANTGAGYSYQWLLGGAVLTGVTGSSYTTSNAGDYTVIVTNATGCSATSNDINISVNPSPTANIALSGPLTFCQGGSVVMTTDYGADYSYQWYDASGAIPYYGQTYTATATGTYYVIVSNSYGCTATSVNMSVLVNPLPDVSITESGSNVFCAGGNVTLSATAGYDYQWYKGGVAIAGATTANYVATTSGGYRVLVTDPATGCSDETHADTMVTEISTTTVVPLTPASFCWGGSVLLSTSVSSLSMVTYQWYFNGAAIPGATGPTYNTALPGNYSVQITIPGSCTMTTLSVPVTEHPLPDPIVSYSGGYFHTAPYYVTYQWYKELIPIGGATLDSTISLGAGNYKVQVTDTFGCQSYSDVYVFNGETGGSGGTTGVQNTYKGDIKIYPNPAQTMVHIDAAIQVRAVITSVDGRTVLNIDAARDINISSLADGIYMIMLYDTNGQMVKAEKLVKGTN